MNEIKDQTLVDQNRILDAAILPMDELQEITKKSPDDRSDDEQMSLQNAHSRGQFGDDFVGGYREGLDEYEKEQEENEANNKPRGPKRSILVVTHVKIKLCGASIAKRQTQTT